MDKTTLFNIDEITSALVETTLMEVYDALKEMEKRVIDDKLTLVDALVQANIASSKREARELITAGSIQVNGDKQQDLAFIVSCEHALCEGMTSIKKGKRNYFVIEQNNS